MPGFGFVCQFTAGGGLDWSDAEMVELKSPGLGGRQDGGVVRSNTFKAHHPVPTERTTQIIWERHGIHETGALENRDTFNK
jgi:hypothetical protein